MSRQAFAAWVVALLTACSSCRESGAANDATVGTDNAMAPFYPFDVILPDRVEPPPPPPPCGRPGRPPSEQPLWADCTLRITPVEERVTAMPACGPGRPVLQFPLGPAIETCVHDGWIYAGRGFTRRVRLSDGRVETLTHPIDLDLLAGSWGCNSRGLVLAAGQLSTRAAAIVHFTDLEHPGRVQWHRVLHVRPGEDIPQGGVYAMRASDVFSFFLLQDESPAYFYVASPTGENPRRLSEDLVGINSDFALGGRYLTYSHEWDIHLYDHVTGRDENLTRSDSVWEQFSAIDGDRVVYIDHRTRTPDDYGNANVWLLDLTTRQRTAITSQPAQPGAQRFSPAFSGDWIIWEDTRNNAVPLPGIDTAPNRQLFGYNLRTRREVPIVTGVYSAARALIVGNRLYYSCALSREAQIGTYVMDLPPG